MTQELENSIDVYVKDGVVYNIPGIPSDVEKMTNEEIHNKLQHYRNYISFMRENYEGDSFFWTYEKHLILSKIELEIRRRIKKLSK